MPALLQPAPRRSLSLFSFIDENEGDVKKLTDAQRNQVVDECYQCKLCYVKCPYVPPHQLELDFRLMSRVDAVRQKQLVGVRERFTDEFLGLDPTPSGVPRSWRSRWSTGPSARRGPGCAS